MKKIYTLLASLLLVSAISAQCTYNTTLTTTNVSCAFNNDGVIAGVISGATGPYTVTLSPQQMTQTVATNFAFTGLQAGNYSVTIVDQVNCTTVLSTTITQPNPITIGGQVSPVACNGGATGAIYVNAAGGNPPFTFLWNNGQVGQVVQGVMAGAYFVTVTDGNGCTAVSAFTVNQPTQLSATITGNLNICAGGTTTLTGQGGGGTPPYHYDWSNGVAGQNALVHTQGTYNLTVTDAHNCTMTATAQVTEFAAFDATTAYTDETCQGNDGTATASGGVSYSWSTGDQTNTITGLPAGPYYVTVTNADGCHDVDTVIVDNPNLVIVFSNILASCNLADGVIFADVVGNPPAPTYAWSDGQVGPTATGLAAGWYSVTITDGGGCQSHRNVYLGNVFGCHVTLSGYVYDDAAAPDCAIDGGTLGVDHVFMEATNGIETHYTYTDVDGYYEFILDTVGTWTVDVHTPQAFLPLCGTSLSATFTFFGEVSDSNNFFMEYSPLNDLMVYGYATNARPGFPQNYYITIINYGGTTLSGDVTVNFSDTLTSFVPLAGGAPVSFTPGSNVAVWHFNNLAPYDHHYIACEFTVPANTPLGEPIYTYGELSPVPGELTPYNNHFFLMQITTGAFDPNEKRAFPGGEGPNREVYDANDLVYVLDFQNTGTDTAFTVVLRDTLDTQHLDIFGIQALAASHPYTLTFEDENVLVFTFDNILLVDSNRNEPASHGFASFRIPVIQPYIGGTVVNNTAAIYFDYNEPVITNNAFVTLAYPVGVNQPYSLAQFSVSPNPATESAQLSYTLQATDRVECWLSDAMGRRVMSVVPPQRLIPDEYSVGIPLQGLESGVYFVTMQTGSGKVTRKLVVF